MKRLLLALLIVATLIVWLLSGLAEKPQQATLPSSASNTASEQQKSPLSTGQSVRVRFSKAKNRPSQLILRGRTEAARRVDLRAPIRGTVSEISVAEGNKVAADTILVRLVDTDHSARLTEAEAILARRLLDYQASVKLSRKGFAADTRKAEQRAALESARAALASRKIDLSYLTIKAPFTGVLASLDVEIGNYLREGDKIGSLLEMDPILVVATTTERDRARLSIGAPVQIRLVSGKKIPGKNPVCRYRRRSRNAHFSG